MVGAQEVDALDERCTAIGDRPEQQRQCTGACDKSEAFSWWTAAWGGCRDGATARQVACEGLSQGVVDNEARPAAYRSALDTFCSFHILSGGLLPVFLFPDTYLPPPSQNSLAPSSLSLRPWIKLHMHFLVDLRR